MVLRIETQKFISVMFCLKLRDNKNKFECISNKPPSRICTSNLTQNQWQFHNWLFLVNKHLDKILKNFFFKNYVEYGQTTYLMSKQNWFVLGSSGCGNCIPHMYIHVFKLSSLIRIKLHTFTFIRKDIFLISETSNTHLFVLVLILIRLNTQ